MLQGQDKNSLRPLSNAQAPVLQGKWNKPWRKKNENRNAASSESADTRAVAARNKLDQGNLRLAMGDLGITSWGALEATKWAGRTAENRIRDKAFNKDAYEKALKEGSNNPLFMDAMRAEAGEFFGDKLDVEETATALDYTSSSYGEYNAVGRRPNDYHDEKVKEKVEILSGALQKYKLQHSIRVYRVIDLNALGYLIGTNDIRSMSAEDIKKQFVGTVIKENGFMSTSVNPDHSWDGEVMMVIDVPAGAKGAPIMGMSSNPSEDEYLFDMGAKMEIKDVKEAGDMLQVNCRMLKQSDGEER